MKTNDKGAGAYAAGAFVFLAWNVFPRRRSLVAVVPFVSFPMTNR
jgi:hypothetical protein